MMTVAIVLSVIAAAGTILSIVFLPEVKIKGKRIPVFFVVPVISAILIVALNVLTFREAWDGLTGDMASMFHGRNSVNPVKILLLFFGMTTVSVFLDEAGVFRFLATKSMKLAGHSRTKLFFILYGVVSILTVFTSNDIIILTFTPFICYFCKNADIDPVPYLVTEFVAANTFSMFFIIGNPTNIYLAESFHMTFSGYLKVMALPTIFGGLCALLVLYLLFKKQFKEEIPVSEVETAKIEKPYLAIFGSVLLIICLVFLIIADYVGIEMWAVATCAFLILVVGALVIAAVKKEKTDGTHKRFQTSALRTNPLCHIYVYRRFVAEKNGRIAKNRRRFRRGGRKVRHIDLRRVVDARRKPYQQYSDERFVLGNHRNRVAFCGVCVGNRQQHRRVSDARRRACGNNVHGAFEKP